jgi:hypothetical protein
MTSQLNVDTIVDKAGSGGTNVKIGNTSVTVAEGGSATTNTVQGLAKAWLNQSDGTTIRDSFNIASITDTSTGVHRKTMTNAMSNANYSGGGSGAASINSETSGNRMMSANPSTTTLVYIVAFDTAGNKADLGYIGSNIFGDLA